MGEVVIKAGPHCVNPHRGENRIRKGLIGCKAQQASVLAIGQSVSGEESRSRS